MTHKPPPPDRSDARSRRLSSFWLAVMLLGLFALLCALLLIKLPYRIHGIHSRAFNAMLDMSHAPAFLLVAAVCYAVVRRRVPGGRARVAAALGLGLLLFGIGMEWAQELTGRDASWKDAAANALGVTAGIALAVGLEAATLPRRIGAVALGLALLAMAEVEPLSELWDCFLQQHEFPRIASFEHLRELDRWHVRDCRATLDSHHATDGRRALRLDFRAAEYPGIVLTDPPQDWSAYDDLVFDVESVGRDPAEGNAATPAEPLELIVKVYDTAHNGRYEDRFERTFRLQPGQAEIRIPLADVAAGPRGRRMDLRHINQLQFYAIWPQPQTIYLDNIRLERRRKTAP